MEVVIFLKKLVDFIKKILELLFHRTKPCCSVCVVTGNCELQALATS